MAARSSTGGTVLASGIRTREKKERKLYSDDWALGDEEIEGHHTFNLEEKITTSKFDLNFVKDMTDSVFNLAYLQKNGFNWPLLFKSTKNLGIVIPKSDFNINDVRLCVGSRRMLDVMDVNTQKNVEMTMKDWQRYYESQDKDKLLNVISLEFSHTKLETLVEAPTVVRQIDWVEKVWPRHLKEAQTESTNVLEDMMYPKVQKYCLMSVSGCYTDFHIDFGGTSVWYHILKGRKIFWLIPPSERNLQLYEQWVLSGKQSDVFFGDTVEKCARVELNAGYTFFIPTGWIHAVYTPDDSLVFGGNFLHSFGIEKQLRAAQVEDTTHVPQKFRYPFFTEMLWYLLERYVHVLLTRTHLTLPPEEQEKFEKAQNSKNNNDKTKEHVHLTQYELHGMKAIVMYLHSLPTSKKFVPELIKDPIALIRDVRTVVEHHRYDSPELAVTNRPVMEWWDREPVRYTVKRSACDSTIYVKKRRQSGDEPKSSVLRLPPNVAKVRHRRVRCKDCEPCTRDDCQQCVFCKDMVKYGGGGTMKQTCKLKKCAQPMLPATASCYICHMDGWMRSITGINSKPSPSMGSSSLMECIICFKISHASCLETKFKGIDCTINEDLPGSWECAECVQLGYNKEYKHNRTPSSRISSAGSDTNAKSPLGLSENEETKVKAKAEPQLLSVKLEDRDGADDEEEEMKLAPTMNGRTIADVGQEKPNVSPGDPPTVKMPTWEQLQARVPYPLVRPSWVIRPAPPPPAPDHNDDDDDEDDDDSGTEDEGDRRVKGKVPISPTMRKEMMLPVFSKLPRNILLIAMQVCRQWAEWAIDPSLWKSLSLAHSSIDEFKLHGVVRRQPSTIILDWSEISYDEFSWLLCRLPQLQSLHCEGVSWGVIRPLVSPYCPTLSELNISFCEGVDDDTLSLLLRPPPFNRPGFRDTMSRLRHLVRLRLAGTQVGDASVSLIVRSLPFLTHVDLSGCLRITDQAIEFLAHSTSLVSHSLTNIDLRGCHQLTPMVLPSLVQLPLLSYLALHPCDFIPLKAIKVWGKTYAYNFDVDNIMTRAPPAKNSLIIDGISDSEGEIQSGKQDLPRKIEMEEKPVDSGASKVIRQGEKGEKRENLSSEVRGVKSKDLSAKNEKAKESLKLIKRDTKDKNDGGDSTVKVKESKSTLKFGAKHDSVQLKCVLTPLEKICKTVESKHGGHASKLEQESATVKEAPGNSKDVKAEKPKDDVIGEKYVESKPGSFRRSERSNKGRKYKLNLAKKKKNGKDKARSSEEKCPKPDDSLPTKKLEGKVFKSTYVKRKREDIDDDSKRRARKNIVTRSKKQRDGEEVSSKQEYEVVPRPLLKSAKGPKDGSGKGTVSSEHDDGLKVRIALKGGPQYVSKLRKKSREDGSCSPSSSPECKRASGNNLKSQPKKADESTGQKRSKETSVKAADESQGASFAPKRKERTRSSSSSSSSPSPSPSPCIPLPKKLKVELKPISKIGRRKSDVLKAPSTPSGNSSSKLEGPSTSGGQGTSSSEKSSSRERPERHHRSPRRLSMCQ